MATLESLLRPVATAINANIAEVTPARELCQKLDNTTIAVRVRNTAIVAYFNVDDEAISLTTNASHDPDVAITASMLTLAKLATSPNPGSARDKDLELSGDVEKAQDFQRLLAYAKPDIEEGLASIIGDVAAHQLGEVARGIGNWAGNARATMQDNVREYLQEESRELPSRYESDRFSNDVDKLRDDIERLAARIDRLRNRDQE